MFHSITKCTFSTLLNLYIYNPNSNCSFENPVFKSKSLNANTDSKFL